MAASLLVWAIVLIWLRGLSNRDSQQISDTFLEQYVFRFKPELLACGYAHDENDRVTALLARMAEEEKIAIAHFSKARFFGIQRGEPHIEIALEVPLETLPPIEAALAGKLFHGRPMMNTVDLWPWYADEGFMPKRIVRPWLDDEFAALRLSPTSQRTSARIMILPAAMIIAAVAAVVLTGPQDILTIATALVSALAALIGCLGVLDQRGSGDVRGDFRLVAAIECIPAIAMTLLIVFTSDVKQAAAAAVLIFFAFLSGAIGLWQSTTNRERLAWGFRWSAARRYFLLQLRSTRPQLRDAWCPWLIALGLGRQVARSVDRREASATWTGGAVFRSKEPRSVWTALTNIANGFGARRLQDRGTPIR